MPLDILAEPLNPRAKWSNLRYKRIWWPWALHDFVSPWRKLCDDTTCLLPFSLTRFWGSNPKIVWPVVLGTKPPNRLEKCIRYASFMISTCVTDVLNHPITKSSSAFTWLSQPPSWLGQHAVYSSSCDLACWCPQVSATTVNLLAILVPRSKPHVHPSLFLVYLHSPSLLDLLHVRWLSLCSTPVHQHSQETCCTHILKPWLVSKLNQSRSSLTNTHHKLDTQGHISTLCSQLMIRIGYLGIL
jgi:hypothetical protein